MRVEPSSVPDVDLIGPDARGFGEAVLLLLGHEPDGVLKPALPYSVIARNDDSRAVALLGVRFDMVGPLGKSYSVVHYADTLRHPQKATLTPGAMRFICAEPLYTDLVLRRAREIDRRGPMNLDNLRKSLQISASLDCAAFDDGQFAGPDSLGAFDRFESEREAEIAFVEEVLKSGGAVETLLERALEIQTAQARDRAFIARRELAKRLHKGLAADGLDGVTALALSHRLRIKLWRDTTAHL
jgi:hypothetical protein